MTEAEKLLQKLDKRSASWQVWIDDGEAIDITYSVDNMKVKQKIDCEAAALIRSQEAKIKRMAEALRDCPTGYDDDGNRYDHGGFYSEWRSRHADALRDAGIAP